MNITEIRKRLEEIIAKMEEVSTQLDDPPKQLKHAFTRLVRLSVDLIMDVYKESEGTRCPFCDSGSLDKDNEMMKASTGALVPSRKVKCRNCGKQWTEEYELVKITVPS